MRFFSYDELIDNYLFLKGIITDLEESYFLHLSRSEMAVEKDEIIHELTIDASFKILAKFELDIKRDYSLAIKDRRKDRLSRKYLKLCLDFRRNCGDYSQPLHQLCRKVKYRRILDELNVYFKDAGNLLHQECSNIKGFLYFRNWYAHGKPNRDILIPDPEDLGIICNDIVQNISSRG